MNRLVTRLILAMLLVALVSLLVVPLAQMLAVRQTLADLPTDFRERAAPPRPIPPLFGQGNPRRFRPPPMLAVTPGQVMDEPQFLREENLRLMNLLDSYRDAQNRAVFFGTTGALLLSLVLAVWLARGIARPIEAVSHAAAELGRGNLRSRVTLPRLESRSDETQRIAHNFNSMAEALECYEAERKAMIADIAHELRNPLATLQMRLDALSDGLVSFNEEEAQLLQGQVGLLARLIDDLRMLSLADAGKLSLNRTTLDLRQLLHNVIRPVEAKALADGVRLEFTLPSEEMLVHADPDRLAQVFNNLLYNALRFTPPGGGITFSLTDLQNEVAVTVRDEGSGIPEEELESIFERFTQGKRRDTGTKTGSGLGLAIVQALVRLHGGRVRAMNHAQGAAFEVVLPRASV